MHEIELQQNLVLCGLGRSGDPELFQEWYKKFAEPGLTKEDKNIIIRLQVENNKTFADQLVLLHAPLLEAIIVKQFSGRGVGDQNIAAVVKGLYPFLMIYKLHEEQFLDSQYDKAHAEATNVSVADAIKHKKAHCKTSKGFLGMHGVAPSILQPACSPLWCT